MSTSDKLKCTLKCFSGIKIKIAESSSNVMSAILLKNKADLMEADEKVFQSEISRVDCSTEGDLYDLLKVEPAVPVSLHTLKNRNNDHWDFKPINKQFSPKRVKSKTKVSTVRDVRAVFEKEVFIYLPNDLDRQRNYLLRKIRDGLSCDEKTKKNAIALIHGDNPISRSAWQMLSNMNAEQTIYNKQYVLWNGKCVQINGSRGGNTKFICNHDLSIFKMKKSIKDSPKWRTSLTKSRKGLLRNSLNVKFKPGPLGKKMFLDDSHHKYQMSNIELVKLPAPVLEILPAYGTTLEPSVANFVTNLRGEKGVITEKFAEFAVSILGTVKNNTLSQVDKNCCVSFDLKYKYEQNRVLMRRNAAKTTSCRDCANVIDPAKYYITMPKENPNKDKQNENTNLNLPQEKGGSHSDENILEIKSVISDMLDSVHISINQDSMYSTEDDCLYVRDIISNDREDLRVSKDKIPKRKHCELDKLDVTIINLPESPNKDFATKTCDKSFCTMGCICESLNSVFRLKQHCGILDCMFGCKCGLSKYKNIDLLDHVPDDIIPGLLNLDHEMNSHMAKEEQKFHQTVIFSGQKSIILKSRKRNWKCSNKYAEFYSKMHLKGEEQIKKSLTVKVEKLCCSNIEPFCMVHYLYKCFCKGKFTESFVNNNVENNLPESKNIEEHKVENETSIDLDGGRIILRPRLRKTFENSKNVSENNWNNVMNNEKNHDEVFDAQKYNDISKTTCSRTLGYHKRKHSNEYYVRTNKKIVEMEQNDTLLKNKMLRLMNSRRDSDTSTTSSNSSTTSSLLNCETFPNFAGENIDILGDIAKKARSNENVSKAVSVTKQSIHDGGNRLVNWIRNSLDDSYKCYKDRVDKGLPNVLGSPTIKKCTLLPWYFILSRYRERKNIYFVTKKQPFRTYIAKDNSLPIFARCINIDTIRFADLPKYPTIVQNLITNASEPENCLCILCGWNGYWEIIANYVHHSSKEKATRENSLSTDNDKATDWIDQLLAGKSIIGDEQTSNHSQSHETKFIIGDEQTSNHSQSHETKFIIGDEQTSNHSQSHETKFIIGDEQTSNHSQSHETKFIIGDEQTSNQSQNKDEPLQDSDQYIKIVSGIEHDSPSISEIHDIHKEKSKWFLLTIESDMSMIQFKEKGFYVTFDGIQNSINISRTSGKTVKLSNHTDLYGVYAIPCNESRVLIGPYEVHESFGFEVIKSHATNSIEKKNKGFWIHTNKVENSEVLHNPLAYIPPGSIRSETIPSLDAGFNNSTNPKRSAINNDLQKKTIEKKSDKGRSVLKKLIKPITIRRTDGFYHLSPKYVLPKVTADNLLASKNSLLKERQLLEKAKTILSNIKRVSNTATPSPSTSVARVRPVAEISPQIKITSVYSQKEEHDELRSSRSSAVLILNPEEINEKILAKPMANKELKADIEQFLQPCIAPQDDVLVISDEENEATWFCKDVWIQCSNVPYFGYLRAKLNKRAEISFEFPGFKYSEFYNKTEAFNKINQVLARKMFIPRNLKLQWRVVQDKRLLKSNMLTPTCLENKKYLMIKLREQRVREVSPSGCITTAPITVEKEIKVSSHASGDDFNTNTEKIKLIKGLEETSKKLERQSLELWNEAVSNRDAILGSLSVPENLRGHMTETLHDIMELNKH